MRERVVNGQCLTPVFRQAACHMCVFNSKGCSQWMWPPDANNCGQVIFRRTPKSFSLNFQGPMRHRSFDSLWVHLPRWHTAHMAASGQIHKSFGNTNASAAGRQGSGGCCTGPLIEFKLEGLLYAEVHRC